MTSVSPSFATHFWGKDDRGCQVVINKMNQGEKTLEELTSFLKEKIAIEEDYSRRMMSLSKKFQLSGIYECGQLKESLETLKLETEQISKSHYNESRKLKYEIYDKMEIFTSNFKGRKKPIETSVENLLTTKQMMTSNVSKLKDRYQSEVTKLNSYIAQESLLLGKELEKNREKIYKQQETVQEVRSDYQISCSKLDELNKVWISNWSVQSANLQALEVERVQYLIKNLWEYSNLVSSACVSDDSSCENLRKSLEICDPDKEITSFVSQFQTGSKIYHSPKFVDFINGDLSNNDGSNIVIQRFDEASRNTSNHTTNSFTSQVSRIAPLNDNHSLHSQLIKKNVSRRPPPSDDGQTSISNPSTNSMLNRQESSYSNPTSISSFTEQIDENLRNSQNWNSPFRRRSRNSENNLTKKSSRRSFIIDQKPSQQTLHQEEAPVYIDLTTNDPLRATLEDLRIGGNGDRSRPQSISDPFSSSISTDKSNGTTIRPKSMIIEDNGNHRLSFHSGMRSKSRSSVNLNGKLLSTGSFPASLTSNGRRIIQQVKALYDFNANLQGELSFKEGDILLVVHKQEDHWWECENTRTKQFGLAPDNYVEALR